MIVGLASQKSAGQVGKLAFLTVVDIAVLKRQSGGQIPSLEDLSLLRPSANA